MFTGKMGFAQIADFLLLHQFRRGVGAIRQPILAKRVLRGSCQPPSRGRWTVAGRGLGAWPDIVDSQPRRRLFSTIYIQRCAGGSYYTGITHRSVDERVVHKEPSKETASVHRCKECYLASTG